MERNEAMGKDSRIEWTDHTFNPWWGCTKVSAACTNCYAEAWAKRVGSKVWGAGADRRFFGDAHWQEPLRWDRAAAAQREAHRVFCASMADVFEDRRDLDAHRERLAGLIAATPNLNWLLLTKRPQKAAQLAPWGSAWPANVWLGTTVESQRWVSKRLPEIAAVPARVRFLSCEPLLGALDLQPWLKSAVHWVIAGGESGARARPTDPAWFRVLRDQCIAAGVPFHFKQWGDWAPGAGWTDTAAKEGAMVRVGKRRAGRDLDGRTWDELPRAIATAP